jgi:hypothetical protein
MENFILVWIIYHFEKLKLDILIHRVSIIRNVFTDGLYVLLDPLL